MAGSDTWEIKVTGKQTHGAIPWDGVDAASVAATIVAGFNQISARQVNVAKSPTVLTVGQITPGQRHNIIPGDFEMTGTLRTFDSQMRRDVMSRIEKTLEAIGEQDGVNAAIRWVASNPVMSNDPALVAEMASAITSAAAGNANPAADYVMGSEDF